MSWKFGDDLSRSFSPLGQSNHVSRVFRPVIAGQVAEATWPSPSFNEGARVAKFPRHLLFGG